MSKRKLPNYGLLKEPDYDSWLLVQNELSSAINLTVAVESFCPPTKFGSCMHSVQLSDPQPSMKFQVDLKGISSDPIFKFMSPLPDPSRKKVLYVESKSFKDTAAICVLQKMVRMQFPLVCPTRMLRGNSLPVMRGLKSSNFARQIITGTRSDNLKEVSNLVSMAMGVQGSVVLIGEKIPPYYYKDIVEFTTISDELSNKILAYENTDQFELLGASLIRGFMRGEKCLRL